MKIIKNKSHDSEDYVNDIDGDSEGSNEVDEDSGNENDEESEKSINYSEAQEDENDIDDRVSDTSTNKMIETVYN